MLELWFVRHGETDWNVEGKVQGWTDIPLNHTGIRQAQELSLQLDGIQFQAVLCSDLDRARHTARILQRRTPAPLTADRLLRERCFGSAEGMFRTEMRRVFPNGAPDAETDEEILFRAAQFLKGVTSAYENGRVLCVSHGGFIRAILAVIGVPDPPQLNNTSVTRLVYKASEWRIVGQNWTDHLCRTEPKVPTDISS